MHTVKTALISPAIDAINAPASPEDQQHIFEQKFAEMAYSTFSTRFPDLVDSIVTFKVLDADMEKGVAVGSFIIEEEGNYLYVPAVLADNGLKPFDLMYVKSKDMFVPLTNEWLEETRRTTLASLGEGAKLPDTVATDVDIRNVVVPPTTGRYSYASADILPHIRLAAESSEPLGRKIANMGMPEFPAEQAPGAPDPQAFDHELWATFVDQYNRLHGTTPGQALDQGMMDIDTMSKMFKSHTKTWSPQEPEVKQAYDYRPFGHAVDDFASTLGRGAGWGAGAGALQAGSDFELADVPSAALRGAIGGALLAPVGRAAGRAIAHSQVKPRSQEALDLGRDIGIAVTGVGGGLAATKAPPDTVSQLTRPSPGAWAEYYEDNPPPYPGMQRQGADYSEGLKAMVKHASEIRSAAPKQLIPFLTKAPNQVKEAFTALLRKDKRILKTAAEQYGPAALFEALKLHKTAGMSMSGGALYVADKDTTPTGYAESFGSDAAEAFNGVLLRGYYYKDKRPSLNLAVQVQEYHDFQEANDAGVYRLYDIEGKIEPALVVTDPVCLLGDDSNYFPKQPKLRRVKVRAPLGDGTYEPDSLPSDKALLDPGPDVERSHRNEHLAIFGNGDYILCSKIAGEQVTELFLKGTALYRKAMQGKGGAPAAGKGVFIRKRGEHYFATKPVELSSISDSEGAVRGTVSSPGGMRTKSFVIDKRSPINRIMRPRDENIVVIPNSWKWVPLKKERASSDYLHNTSALSAVVLDALGSMGAGKAVVRNAGQSQFTVDGKTTDKAASLRHIAEEYCIPARDAEAMLKVAAHTGRAEAYVVSPKQLRVLRSFEKQAQGQLMPEGEMAPANAPSSSVDMAFSEAMEALTSQVEQIQSQLSVLQLVQQRAMQIDAEQSGMPMDPSMDPSMQGQPMDPSMDPSMQGQPMDPSMDPSMQAQPMDPSMDPSMQGQPMDPSMQGQEAALPVMFTEAPSAQEIEQQINPDFLAQAGELNETGAFDAGAIASLAQSPSLQTATSDYAASMESTLDDLGRTLLTLYMQEPDLKEQLGEESFVKLESQLRDNFKGLGALLVSLTHQTPLLSNRDES